MRCIDGLRLAMCAAVASAQLLMAPACEAGELTPAAVMEIEPWGIGDAAGKPQGGIYAELTEQIAFGAGLVPSLRLRPYARVILEMQTGDSVLALMSQNPAIDSAANILAPVMRLDIVIVGLEGSRFSSLADLHGKTVATLSGTDHDAAFRENRLIQKNPVKSYEQGLTMLQLGRVDAIFGVRQAMMYAVKKLREKGIGIRLGDPLYISQVDGLLYLSKRHDDLRMRRRLMESLERLKTSGGIDRIARKYLE